MTVDREGDDGRMHTNWATVGLTQPFLPGISIPQGWQRFEVTFERSVAVDDGHGGYKDGVPIAYLTTSATVSQGRAGALAGPYAMDSGARSQRRYRIRLHPIPDVDGATYPRIGDTVLIRSDTDPKPLRATIMNVSSPLMMTDHVLIEAERNT